MSEAYEALAGWYDRLTLDVPYGEFLEFYEKIFMAEVGEHKTVLDLCCGTGTLTLLMAEKGYEMIAVDSSPDMLMQASSKDCAAAVKPLFLCQEAAQLDLYGTVDAAICSLDGMDYIPPEELPEVFRRLRLFIRPGGTLIFDVRTPEWLRARDGEIFVDETDELLCLWRADFDFEENALCYGMDIFEKRGRLWARQSEEHVEYAHEPEDLKALLEDLGFENTVIHTECPQGDDGRCFISAARGKSNG